MNDNVLFYAILTFVAAFAGAFGWGVSQKVSPGIRGSLRNVLDRPRLGIKRLFRWGVTEVKERHRVSGFRHRPITWEDLPQESKDLVKFHDLSESARNSIMLRDLPRNDKDNLLDRFILPKLRSRPFEGQLSLLDDRDSITLTEAAQITVSPDDYQYYADQEGLQIILDIKFENPENEIRCPRGAVIGFESGPWRFVGKTRERGRISPGSQRVVVWITFLSFDRLDVYREAR